MEDTQDNAVLLEQMLRNTEKGKEPGELAINPVVHEGDDAIPVPMIGRIKSAGYSIVYDTKTGISSNVNNNMLLAMLRKKRPDGTPFFGTKQTVKPRVGKYKCLLHKEDPNREHYNDIGLAVCPKDNLASTYQVMRHMQKRHKTEWGAIDQERKDAEKKEDKEFQRALMSGIKPPLHVSKKDKAK